jgi:hypothetical protein
VRAKERQNSASSHYVLKVKQEGIFITNVDTREVWSCAIMTSNDVSQSQMEVAEGCYHFNLTNRLMIGDVLRLKKKNVI